MVRTPKNPDFFPKKKPFLPRKPPRGVCVFFSVRLGLGFFCKNWGHLGMVWGFLLTAGGASGTFWIFFM